jgi:hypothetical protein
MTQEEVKPKRSVPVMIWMILSQIIMGLGLLPWLVASMMSIMAFDGGASAQTYLFVGSIWSWPVFAIALSGIAWWRWRKGNVWLPAILTTIPLLPVVLLLMVMTGTFPSF